MNPEILNKIKRIKQKYEAEGFILLGIFGSYARGEQTPESDIDILYDLNEHFYTSYRGLEAYGEIERIRQELAGELHKSVDMAGIRTLNDIGKKYILPEVLYV